MSISQAFLTYASDILGDTNAGLSGNQIVRYTCSFSVDYNVKLPHDSYPFEAANKRTALNENLSRFSPEQQFEILLYLCNLDQFEGNEEVVKLKSKLITSYPNLSNQELSALDTEIVKETEHWLARYKPAHKEYTNALQKYQVKIYERNLLDDLRLSLELLLKEVLENEKSLENQNQEIGKLLKSSNASAEFRNMFHKILEYFSKYQNSHVKHSNNVVEQEIEFVFELTSLFMKNIIKLSSTPNKN